MSQNETKVDKEISMESQTKHLPAKDLTTEADKRAYQHIVGMYMADQRAGRTRNMKVREWVLAMAVSVVRRNALLQARIDLMTGVVRGRDAFQATLLAALNAERKANGKDPVQIKTIGGVHILSENTTD